MVGTEMLTQLRLCPDFYAPVPMGITLGGPALYPNPTPGFWKMGFQTS